MRGRGVQATVSQWRPFGELSTRFNVALAFSSVSDQLPGQRTLAELSLKTFIEAFAEHIARSKFTSDVTSGARVTSLLVSVCGGLNDDVSQRRWCLNTWSPIGGTV